MQEMRARRIGFIFIPGFALLSAASAVEPLRAANLLSQSVLYDMVFLSEQGGAVTSSVGAAFDTIGFDEISEKIDAVFVVAGGDPLSVHQPRLNGFLHRQAAMGATLGGISGGAAILEDAGLLNLRRFTIHWEHFDALKLRAPDSLMERRLFVLDRDRATCAGGSAPLDMMHAIVMSHHGARLANKVSEWFIHTGLRNADDPQRRGAASAYNFHHKALETMVDLMWDHLADPLSLIQLAGLCGLSSRQLERLCHAQLGHSVMVYYRLLRLKKAQELLRQTVLPAGEVAFAVGFSNGAHFSRVFREAFGMTPTQYRNHHEPFEPPHDQLGVSGTRD